MGDLIRKHNKLIEAKNNNLTIYQQRIMLKLLTLINKNDTEFKEHKINISEFSKQFDFNVNYERLEIAVDNLMRKVFHIDCEDGGWKKFNYFEKAECLRKDGILLLKISNHMKPYFLQLQKEYTNYRLGKLGTLKNKYCFGIYELVKQYLKTKHRKRSVSLKYLLEFLEIDDKPAYKNFKLLNQKILSPVNKEINEMTDITYEYRGIRKSKFITDIEFYDIKEKSKIIENIDNGDNCSIEKKEVFIKNLLKKIARDEEKNNRKINHNYKHRKNIIKKALKDNYEEVINNYYEMQDEKEINHVDYYFKNIIPLCKEK